MSKIVQRRRGTTAEHTTFTGALGELTVDTTKDTIVVHDGAAAGGYPLAREDMSNVPAGTVTSTMIADGTIVNDDVNASAAIVDTKLATISTAGKVSNSATTATNANTASAIVARDASGNFSAGTITAALTGAASANVLKAGDTMTGVLAVTAGTDALPSVAFTGDPNTGIYSPGADQVAISTNAVERVEFGTAEVVFNDGGANYDFRIEGDTNANLFFVDASTDRVGLGTSSPNALLHLNGGTINVQGGTGSGNGADINLIAQNAANFFNGGAVNITAGSATLGNANGGNIILTPGARTSAGTFGYLGIGTSSPTSYVHAVDNTGIKTINHSSALIASNVTAGGFTDGVKTALEIQSTGSWGGTGAVNRGLFVNVSGGTNNYAAIFSGGNVGIGTTAPVRSLQVGAHGSGNGEIALASSTTGNNSILFGDGASDPDFYKGYLQYQHANNVLVVKTESGIQFADSVGERARIDSSGRLLIGTSTAQSGTRSQYSKFTVQGNNQSTSDGAQVNLAINTNAASLITGYTLGQIIFTDNGPGEYGRIACQMDGAGAGSGDYPGRLVFSVTADGAASPTEALRISNDRSITVSDGGNVILGTTTGTKIGTGTTQKLGFYNATPVVQPTAVADATDAASVITQLNALLAKLRTLGIIAT